MANNKKLDFDNVDSLLEEDNILNETQEDDTQTVSFKSGDKSKQTSNKKGKKKVKDPDEKGFSLWGVMLKHVLPLVTATIVFGITGFFLGKLFYEEPEPVITDIVGKTDIQDKVNKYQEDQMDALRSQFKAIDPSGQGFEEGFKNESAQNIIKAVQNQTDVTIEPFMKRFLTLPQYMDDSEKEVARKDLMKYVTDSGANALYPLLTGRTPAIDMEGDGKKVGATTASIIGIDKESNPVYLTLTPYEVNGVVRNALFVVKLNEEDSDKRIEHITYVGLLHSDTVNNNTYKAIDDALNDKAFTESDKEDSED